MLLEMGEFVEVNEIGIDVPWYTGSISSGGRGMTDVDYFGRC